MPNANCFRFSTITSEARSTRCAPMRRETVVDLRSDPFHIIDDIRNAELSPPRDREDFMDWYLARRLEDSNGMSSREVQSAIRDAEDVWRFVSGERDFIEIELPMRPERTERERLWSRTYINAKDRRKGNAVIAVTIRC